MWVAVLWCTDYHDDGIYMICGPYQSKESAEAMGQEIANAEREAKRLNLYSDIDAVKLNRKVEW